MNLKVIVSWIERYPLNLYNTNGLWHILFQPVLRQDRHYCFTDVKNKDQRIIQDHSWFVAKSRQTHVMLLGNPLLFLLCYAVCFSTLIILIKTNKQASKQKTPHYIQKLFSALFTAAFEMTLDPTKL